MSPESENRLQELKEMSSEDLKAVIEESVSALEEDDLRFYKEQLDNLMNRKDISDEAKDKKERDLNMMMVVGFEN